ncbi:MAG: hypothetical protein ACM4AI_26175 [Acidobacteriota bacterium]
MTTSLLIVGLLAIPPAVNEPPQPENPQVAVQSIRRLLGPDAFQADSATRLKLEFRPEAGEFSTLGSTADRATHIPSRPAVQSHRRSITRKIIGAAVGAFGGFFLGGYAGAAIEGDRCGCDDPGLQGFLIGAPIGAVAGGIFGAWIVK